MTQSHPALLPTGLADVLPPVAAQEAAAAERAMSVLRADGYEQATPPMLEFEESFLTGAGEPLARETFRMMDPASQRMLALRSDMTPQIARIAASRLEKAPRPLRLCYLGAVMRVSGGRAGGERQFLQAGAELIGSGRAEADAEIVLLAANALAAIGVAGVSVDLNVPRMAGEIADGFGLDDTAMAALLAALDRKDMAETLRLAPAGIADLLAGLI
ncbi:MAG: ATP phosphoribosyltransferase regulatory subunit, partial [Alphaproteobacteria bacterium]